MKFLAKLTDDLNFSIIPVKIDYSNTECVQTLNLVSELQKEGYCIFSTLEEAKEFLSDKIEREISWLKHNLDKVKDFQLKQQ